MFIQTELTPNPASMKFLPGQPIMGHGTADFPTPDTAQPSPLAQRLFEVKGVNGVFFGSNFITVTKTDDIDWLTLKPVVLGVLARYLLLGEPVIYDYSPDSTVVQESWEQDVVIRIRELLSSHIRPAVARDGGDIVFRGFHDGVVYLCLQGSCAGCPSATATLKNGIENLLRHYIPEVESVQAVN